MSNLANAQDVKTLERKAKELRQRELMDIKTVLSNKSGIRLLWRVLEYTQSFGSVFSTDQARMAYNSGRQDVGHFLMGEITTADENLLFKLMRENKPKDGENA